MVLGRHSGRAGFKDRIIRLGFQPKQDELELAYTKFLEIADKKKEIFDEDIISLFTDQHRKTGISRFVLEYFHISTGSKTVPTATIKLRVNDVIIEESATGDGPVDAVFKAIEKATKMEPELSRLVISPVTEGKDALAEASVTLNLNGKRVVGKGGSTDIIEASALSFIDALNRL
jgi:2-isopropylmalate synthase